ncbi:SLC13 family permease [Bacteroides fluxus]|jgi:sodium-dependent dicarboxylate transporter 2/3/5|uniref:Transporter, DASS family n=1 Tax=Bacteroides fluxus YIT 12057 TaxID=763034 RepID=F3PQA6_9BACE|nr:SLC13 family permease [Bacteroides fluxus]EGF59148.1 transporter, DASS family [Bacteroides fluxus YIT 12057]
MYKMFRGFHLVEAYQELKKAKRLAEDQTVSRIIKLTIATTVALVLWGLPTDAFGVEGLTFIEQRLISIFVFATLMWVFEAVPAWTTSVLIVVLLLLTVSDSSLWFFRQGYSSEELGQAVKYKSIMHCFADPIIMLFIGGFILAIAATKSGLDVLLARVMLKPFGTQSRYVLLGFILVTAFFSMFLSNTATAAMMLTFLTPVLKALPADGKGKIGLALAIPVAANVGGMGTPIGTPPNAIALKYLNDPEGLNMNIGFGEWMSFMMPYTIIVLFIAWFILLRLFPFKQKTIELQIEGEAKKDWRSIVVYITFAITVLLWMSDKFTGVNSNVVAMIPVAVFCITGVITKRDLEEISWSVLWMVAGGFALGVALNETGLAKHMIEAIPFNTWSPVVMIVGSGLICYAMANFISHTATAALLVPILAIAGISMRDTLQPMGGVLTLLVGVALGSSLAMVLPISTPPNALAHATGMIKQKDMEKVGLIMGAIGLVLGYAMLIFLGSSGLL